MTEKIHVEFTVPDGGKDALLARLQVLDDQQDLCLGLRADDYVSRRAALVAFVDQMELKLRKNEHKRNWRDKPIQALMSLMSLEWKEFEVSLQYFTVGEARAELPDICNFAMMVWDRLGTFDQEQNLFLQIDPAVPTVTQAHIAEEQKWTK